MALAENNKYRNISGIYKITSLCNPSKFYIGSAVDISERWRLHTFKLRSNGHENSKLQNHYNKYGHPDLKFTVVKLCEKNELLLAEQYFLDNLDPFFNICKTASSRLGVKTSETVRLKQSISAKNRPPITKETRKKLSEAHKGKKHCLGWKQTKEHIENVSLSKAKSVICIYSGFVYTYMKDAAKSINMPYKTFCNQLNGTSKNKTRFIKL